MLKFIIMLLVLLAACVVWGIFRKIRGGTFLPPPDTDDAPRTLEEVHKQKGRSK
jgi:hypothetical protein